MKIFKTFLATHGPGGAVQITDTIEYGGKLWLVPEWLDSQEQGMTMPARIVRPLLQSFHESQMKNADYRLEGSIPTHILQGRIVHGSETEFEIVERPPILFRGGLGVN